MPLFQSVIVIVAFTISIDWVTFIWALGRLTRHLVLGSSCVCRALLAAAVFCDELAVHALGRDAALSVFGDDAVSVASLASAVSGDRFVLTAPGSFAGLAVCWYNGVISTDPALAVGHDPFSCLAFWGHAISPHRVWYCVWLTFFTLSIKDNNLTLSTLGHEALESIFTHYGEWITSFASAISVENFILSAFLLHTASSIVVNDCEGIAKLAGSIRHNLLSVTAYWSFTLPSTGEHGSEWWTAFAGAILYNLLTRTTGRLLTGCQVAWFFPFTDDTLVWPTFLASSCGGLLLSFAASWGLTFHSGPVWFLESGAGFASRIRQHLLSCFTCRNFACLAALNSLLISWAFLTSSIWHQLFSSRALGHLTCEWVIQSSMVIRTLFTRAFFGNPFTYITICW